MFGSLVQAVFLASVLELFFGHGYVNSGAILSALMVSTFGLFLWILATAAERRRKLR